MDAETKLKPEMIARQVWSWQNRNVLSEIARELDLTIQTVSVVFRGRNRSARVERALAERGCPGFENATLVPTNDPGVVKR